MVRPRTINWLMVVLSGLLVCGLVWLAVSPAPKVAVSAGASPAREASGAATASPAASASASAPAAKSPSDEPVSPPSAPIRDGERAAKLRDALMALQGVPSESVETGGGAKADTATQSDLAPYVQSLLQTELAPLVGDCYQTLLSRNSTAKGNVFLELAVLGDHAFGGVIANTALGPGSTLNEPTFHACLKDSFASLVLPAPPAGHSAFTIEQSFELEP